MLHQKAIKNLCSKLSKQSTNHLSTKISYRNFSLSFRTTNKANNIITENKKSESEQFVKDEKDETHMQKTALTEIEDYKSLNTSTDNLKLLDKANTNYTTEPENQPCSKYLVDCEKPTDNTQEKQQEMYNNQLHIKNPDEQIECEKPTDNTQEKQQEMSNDQLHIKNPDKQVECEKPTDNTQEKKKEMSKYEKAKNWVKSKIFWIISVVLLVLSVLIIEITSVNDCYLIDFQIDPSNILFALAVVGLALIAKRIKSEDRFKAIGGFFAALLGARFVKEKERISSSNKMFEKLLKDENRNRTDQIAYVLKYIDKYDQGFSDSEDMMERLISFVNHYFNFLNFYHCTALKSDEIVKHCMNMNSRERFILSEVYNTGVHERFFDLYFETFFFKRHAKEILLLEKYLERKNNANKEPKTQDSTNTTAEEKMKQKIGNLLETNQSHCFVSFHALNGKRSLCGNLSVTDTEVEEFKVLVKECEKKRLDSEKKKYIPSTISETATPQELKLKLSVR